MHININKKYLTFKNFKVKCAIGKKGIGLKKKEGDLITPKGSFRVKRVFYRKDRIKYFESKIPKSIIQKNMGWCDDPKSKYYNKLIRLPFSFSFEKLYRKDNIYDLILVLNYNISPIKKNKGSAIFIHIAKRNFSSTKGCVAIRKFELIKLIKYLNKSSKVNIT